MTQVYYAGIDVSARSLDVALALADQSVRQGRFANTLAGHRQLIKWLTKGGRSVQVCLEATGLYSFEVASALHAHPHCAVMVVNPKTIKHYAQARQRRAKTDALDAQLLLDYGQRLPFVSWQSTGPEILQLQAITRRITQLKVERTRELNRLHADSYRTEGTALIKRDIEVNIRHIERRLARLEAEGRTLVLATPRLCAPFRRLLSIPGIGETSALRILAELAVLSPDMKPPQWVAHAGLDPRPRESGSPDALARQAISIYERRCLCRC
jgi:transposase